jgi:beta-N-acetylhexosaminidase
MNTPLGPLIIDIAGYALTPAEKEMITHPWVGGIIYFTRNFQSKQQIIDLGQEIRAARAAAQLPVPLICIDHEGGRVQRFREGFTEIPAMGAIGAQWVQGDPASQLAAMAQARQAGFTLATELLAVGIDFSFAPVVDLDWGHSEIIGARAFSGDPSVVTALAASLMHGLAIAGMKNCAKHFPGHGWAHADSHLALPQDDRPLEEILRADAAPYAQIGSPTISSVMPAHIQYTAVDQAPAGFSQVWIKDILRGRLGFQGVVISDDLSMAGAAVLPDIVDRAHAAFEAGCDATLICNSPDLAARVIDQLPQRMPNFLNDPGRQGLEQLLPLRSQQLLQPQPA